MFSSRIINKIKSGTDRAREKKMDRVSLKETIMKFFNVDLPISGGYGSSMEDAIRIEVSDAKGVSVEQDVLKFIHAFGEQQFKVIRQELLHKDDRVYDKIELEVSTDPEHHQNYYFDITRFFGK
jgi:hypothetical protein